MYLLVMRAPRAGRRCLEKLRSTRLAKPFVYSDAAGSLSTLVNISTNSTGCQYYNLFGGSAESCCVVFVGNTKLLLVTSLFIYSA